MNAFVKFNKGIMSMPVGWQIWLLILVIHNMIVPLFYIGRTEAQVVFAAIMLSMGLMTFITARVGFTRLLGIGHILWIPMLFWLWSRLPQLPAADFYGLWLRSLITVNLISLVLDAVDVARYLAGDRSETVSFASP